MNFKFLFPTFRNRYLFVRDCLTKYFPQNDDRSATRKGLNLGTGEGDYDRMLATHCSQLIGCDVNEEDLAHARALNAGVENLYYELNDALSLSYADQSFDLVVSCEVIEHVGQPGQMLKEIGRVLRPGGLAIMTFPSREFPFTYDPVNRLGQLFGIRARKEFLISQGAYSFGHEYLIGTEDFKRWAIASGFDIVELRGLSHHLVGLLEMYWTGIAQGIFKKNARNVTAHSGGKLKIRPTSAKEPWLTIVTDLLIRLDRALFFWSDRSVGKGAVLRKKN